MPRQRKGSKLFYGKGRKKSTGKKAIANAVEVVGDSLATGSSNLNVDEKACATSKSPQDIEQPTKSPQLLKNYNFYLPDLDMPSTSKAFAVVRNAENFNSPINLSIPSETNSDEDEVYINRRIQHMKKLQVIDKEGHKHVTISSNAVDLTAANTSVCTSRAESDNILVAEVVLSPQKRMILTSEAATTKKRLNRTLAVSPTDLKRRKKNYQNGVKSVQNVVLRELRVVIERQQIVENLLTFDEEMNERMRNINIHEVIAGNLQNDFVEHVIRRGPLYMHAAERFNGEHSLGNMDNECVHCHALFFRKETNSRGVYMGCCRNGAVAQHPEAEEQYPQEIRQYFEYPHFKENIRSYNNIFAMASLAANIMPLPGPGPFCFKVQGQIYHNMANVAPNLDDERRRYGNLYFIDTALANDIRARQHPELEADIIDTVSLFLQRNNVLVRSYKLLLEVYQNQEQNNNQELQNYELVIDNRRNGIVNFGNYGAVQANEVAGIFISENGEPPRDRCIVIYCRDQRLGLRRISYLSANCDPMMYPILFPFGEPGWIAGRAHERIAGEVSLLEHYAYKFAVRYNVFNPIIMAGKLTQQFCVDSYLKVEQSRLDYFRYHQANIRADMYRGLLDYLNEQQLREGYAPGNVVILPSSFLGSPRSYRQMYLDAMSIAAKYGKPDLFVTFTCNPMWQEIQENLFPRQTASDRPDLVSRVFNCKLNDLIADIDKQHIFGVCQAYVYVIEFQKRGLPHAHILVWLARDNKLIDAAAIDRIISAEFPDELAEPVLFEIVRTNMVHGPCRLGRCLDNQNHCTKHFPKDLRDETYYNHNGYPIYRRRFIDHNILAGGRVVNNGWVVPYNPYLTKKYKAHINVEACTSMKSVKYLFKYIYKGYDRARAIIRAEQQPNAREGQAPAPQMHYDEIQMFLDVRYISAPEGMWRLLKFLMHDITHSIIKLPVHLPNEQQIYFRAGEEEQAAERAADRHTMLTAWFTLNRNDVNAQQYTYVQIPYHYVYNANQRTWHRRIRNFGRIIPRIYFVHPREGERFFLRQLLYHIAGAQSFEHLRTVDNTIHPTFRSAAVALNLLDDDQIWIESLNEAVRVDLPKQLRRMFGYMLLFCNIGNPLNLWNDFRQHISEDYIRRFNGNEERGYNCALTQINRYLAHQGKTNADFNLPMPEGNDIPVLDQDDGNNFNVEAERQIALNNVERLNAQQRFIFDRIIDAVVAENARQRCFFLDGQAGCGKTFLINTIITHMIGINRRYVAMAFTGIAANLLKGGQTVHSAFMLPVPFLDDSVSKMRNQSIFAENLRYTRLIIWDEVSMASRHMFRAIDEKLQDLMGNHLLFGGKIMLVCGDFRQIAPIIRLGGKRETLAASVKAAPQWRQFLRFELRGNIRALPNEEEFQNWLINIGNSSHPVRRLNNDYETIVNMPKRIIVNDVVVNVYGHQNINAVDLTLLNKAILCPQNLEVANINRRVMQFVTTDQEKTYYSFDSIIRQEDNENDENVDLEAMWPVEFLNSIETAGLPPHVLHLKKGCVIMLLKNLDVKRNLCNGTRLVVTNLREHFIEGQLIRTDNDERSIELIPRVDNSTLNNTDIPVNFNRRQFPVKLAFAMTINKSQGQTFEYVGLNLPSTVFSHGQLYVALSRSRGFDNIAIQMNNVEGRQDTNATFDNAQTVNVVYEELLNNNIENVQLPE